MAKKKNRKKIAGADPRLDPEQRLTPAFDSTGIKKFPIADAKQMGMRVKDNFPEEHIT